jgi:hypothetical protein
VKHYVELKVRSVFFIKDSLTFSRRLTEVTVTLCCCARWFFRVSELIENFAKNLINYRLVEEWENFALYPFLL